MGESVSEGIVSRWLKAVGDTVDEGEPLVEVTTDKVDVEVPSPVTGRLTEIVAAEGETVAVGATLAVIAPGPAAVPVAAPSAEPATAETEPPPPPSGASEPKTEAAPAVATETPAAPAGAPPDDAPRAAPPSPPPPAEPAPAETTPVFASNGSDVDA